VYIYTIERCISFRGLYVKLFFHPILVVIFIYPLPKVYMDTLIIYIGVFILEGLMHIITNFNEECTLMCVINNFNGGGC